MNYKNKLAMLSFAFLAGCHSQNSVQIYVPTPEQAAENILNNNSIVAKGGGRWSIKKTQEGTEVKRVELAGAGGKRTIEFKLAADGTMTAHEYEETLRCKRGNGPYTSLFFESKTGYHQECRYKAKKGQTIDLDEKQEQETQLKVLNALMQGRTESAHQMKSCQERHGKDVCKMGGPL